MWSQCSAHETDWATPSTQEIVIRSKIAELAFSISSTSSPSDTPASAVDMLWEIGYHEANRARKSLVLFPINWLQSTSVVVWIPRPSLADTGEQGTRLNLMKISTQVYWTMLEQLTEHFKVFSMNVTAFWCTYPGCWQLPILAAWNIDWQIRIFPCYRNKLLIVLSHVSPIDNFGQTLLKKFLRKLDILYIYIKMCIYIYIYI